MERCLNNSSFIKWFEINKIVNNSAVDVTLDNLRQNLSNGQLIRILTSGIKHCFNNSEANDTIIDDIHFAIKDVKFENNNNNVNNTKLKDKKGNKRAVMIKSVEDVFSIDNLYFNILQFLNFNSLFVCASINVDWLYHVYDSRSLSYFKTNTNTNRFFNHKNRNFWPFRNAQKVEIDNSYDYKIPKHLRQYLCDLKMVKHLQLKKCSFDKNDVFAKLIENNICRLESFSIGNVYLHDDFWSFFTSSNIGNIKSLSFDNITSQSRGAESPTDRKGEEEPEEKEEKIPILLESLPKMIKKMSKLSSFTWIDKRINGTFKPIIIDEILKEACNVKYLTLSFNGKEFSDKKLNKMKNDYKYRQYKLKYNNFKKLSGLTIVLRSYILYRKDFDNADKTNNRTNYAQTTTMGNGTIGSQVKNFEKMIMLRKIQGQFNTCTLEYVCESLTIKDDINSEELNTELVAEIATQMVNLLLDRYKSIINGYDTSEKNNNMGIDGLEECDTTNSNNINNKEENNNDSNENSELSFKHIIDRNRTGIDSREPIIKKVSIDLSNESSISNIFKLLELMYVLNYVDKRIILDINIKIIKTLSHDLGTHDSELHLVPKLLGTIQTLREKFHNSPGNSDSSNDSDCNSSSSKSKLKLCIVACYDGYLLHDCECSYCQNTVEDDFLDRNPLDPWMSSFKEILCHELEFIEWWEPREFYTYQSPSNLNEIAISITRVDRANRKIVV